MKKQTNHNILAELVDVSKVYPGARAQEAALKSISLTARPGEMILLLGLSGSGKTTLLTILAGLQPASGGEVFLFGRRVRDYSAAELQSLRAERIGFIFQSFCLIESLTALENVMLVLKFAGLPRRAARQRALAYFRRFGIEHLGKAYPSTLSQGEKQRVAVARALANEAGLIIADEPTGSLATEQGFAIIRYLHECVRLENRCVVVASHDERIAEWADRVFSLRDGSISSQTDLRGQTSEI